MADPMKAARYKSRTLIRLLRVLALLVALMMVPGTAQAHAVVVSSDPEPGARLGVAPSIVTIRFSEPLDQLLSTAAILSPDGRRFAGRVSTTSITIALATDAPGTYRVTWKAVSADDGHTTSGTFGFSVVSSGAAPRSQAGSGDIGLAAAILRALQYAALLIAIGSVLLRRLARRDPWVTWVRPHLRMALAVLVAAGAATAITDALAASSSTAGAGRYLLTTLPGAARISAIALEAVALLASSWDLPVWPALVGVAVALAASGHPADIHPAWWGVSVDAAHLVAAGLWAGAIMALATIRPPGGWRGAEGRQLLDRFSPVALTAFGVTVALGVVQAYRFLPDPGALLHSSYGRLLGVKILAVGAMVPLSVLAWRRRIVTRAEAGVAAVVVLAAALMSAYPLPPIPVARAEAAVQRSRAEPGLPLPGDMTLGGRAGAVLVALTVRPARPGKNVLFVYVEPLGGADAAARLPVGISVDGWSLRAHRCSPWCRRTTAKLEGRTEVTVRVGRGDGGTVQFHLPPLPAPDGGELFRTLRRRMHGLHTYRLREVFATGVSAISSTYEFQAPDRLHVSESSGFELVWIGSTRYQQQTKGSGWIVQKEGTRYSVPSFIWDYVPDRRFDFRVVGRTTLDGTATNILSFYGAENGAPYWFRLWVDPRGLVLRAEMRGAGHFMDQMYDRFDAPIRVEAPPIPSTP